MKHIEEYKSYTKMDIPLIPHQSEHYRDAVKIKMNDKTLDIIKKKTACDRESDILINRDNSIEYWDKHLNTPNKIIIYESKDEWFYLIVYVDYINTFYKCDQIDGLIQALKSYKQDQSDSIKALWK